MKIMGRDCGSVPQWTCAEVLPHHAPGPPGGRAGASRAGRRRGAPQRRRPRPRRPLAAPALV